MKLYHGSNIAIERIDFARYKPYKDFGQGFYLTKIEEQAMQMARRTTAIYGGKPIVTVFEFDETAVSADELLAVKRFSTPNEEWALFVMANRSRESKYPVHNYDIVIGPVTDDTIATLFRNFDDGIIDLPMLVVNCATRKFCRNISFTRHAPSSI